jgi:hypothetical protein
MVDQERIGVCVWPTHDPRHPSNVVDEPVHSPEPETAPLAEEVTDTLTLRVISSLARTVARRKESD